MGIQGLLQFIKEAAEPTHVKKYKGQAVAVDTYCWLHKGAYACAEKLARGEPTDLYVAFCMKLVDMLLSFGIKPILVFDGCTLPSKKEVEKARREKRQANLLKGKQLLQEGRLSEARECFGRSVNVTHAMAHEVIKAARARGVDCIVAPYEADAQLAYLNKTGMVQAIITEDSDLLAFGCKKVLLKIDKFGNGLEIDQARLGNCKQLGNVFTEEKFRYMCILSGCDYLPSIHGIGLAKACKLLKLANNPDIIKVIKKMGQYLKMNITVSEEYIQGFTRANNTFLYQLVFDPVKRKLVPLNGYGDDVDPEALTYAGRHFGDDTAFQIAIGNVDIDTMEQIDNYNPDTAQPVQQRSRGWNDRHGNHVNSIWSRDYKLGPATDAVPHKMYLPEKPTTRGMVKIISVKSLKSAGKELFAKRPRSEEISDGDLLNQYSFSKAKKFKKESAGDGQAQKSVSAIQSHDSSGNSVTQESSNSLPRVRNKFAFFLQRKNKEKDAVIVPGTRSRFFCNNEIMFDGRAKKDDSDLTQDAEQDCQKQEVKHVAEDVSQLSDTDKLARTVCTPPGETQKGCFRWLSSLMNNSGNPGPPHPVFSQQLHQGTNSCVVPQEDQISGVQPESGAVCDESEEESSVMELERSLQSQRSCETSVSSLEFSEIPEDSSINSSNAEESDSKSKMADDQCKRSPVFSGAQTGRKIVNIKTKIFLVRKEANVKNMVLAVCLPVQNESPSVLEYNIKEEKSILYLEGSVLVFEDIFKLVAFYCVSRDLLPFTLKLPQAILEACSFQDLEIISSLGIDFWDSSLNHRRREDLSHSAKDSAFSTVQADSLRSTQCFASSINHCSCEIELSIGNDRLWFVNPIFIEECSNPFPPDVPPPKSHSMSTDLPPTTMLPERRSPRRPPPPPPSHAHVQKSLKPLQDPMTTREENELLLQPLGKSIKEMKTEGGVSKGEGKQSCSASEPSAVSPKKGTQPSVPPRRRLSERTSEESCVGKPGSCETLKGEQREEQQYTSTEKRDIGLLCKKAVEMPGEVPERSVSHFQEAKPEPAEKMENMSKIQSNATEKGKSPPIPPPRRKRLSQVPRIPKSCQTKQTTVAETAMAQEVLSKSSSSTMADTQTKTEPVHGHKSIISAELKGSHSSLEGPGGSAVAQASASEPDSYSTSSTEDDLEVLSSSSSKKTRSVILDRAKNRLSFASLSNVFTVFLSSDRKLQKKIVELAQDKGSYFGNLVRDYRVYSLEMMAKQSSSTEMLQEIRMMMTQLKSYLVQSTELKTLIDPASYTEEQLEIIAETALYKCVLKPLKEAIDTYLKEIHSKDGSLQQLKENQLVIQNTTTTDLGITTSVPETVVLEKILHKFTTMYKAYSPEKKIAILLKSCKLIYDSMAQGNPGKPYGADDFLPVLMYVLARSNLTEVLLNVEYVMELMDPALQLGEGSYYLTTTYGALEHIKNYDKITVTRQLSVEVQDSIHRWERRRTLNKARASRSSVQDFISISFMEIGGQSRTLASRKDTTAEQLSQQCAEKFEVSHPKDYHLFVYVDDHWLQLNKDALPHHIKASLLKSETKKDFHFIYKPIDHKSPPVPIVKESDFH